MFNIVLFGPPGSGKGTQSSKLVNQYHLKHLGTGDLLRNEIAKQTPLGLEARKFIDKGELVPDEVVIGMISSAIEENLGAKGFLFDGFPRTEAQAEALDKLLKLKNTEISVVLALQVSEEELIKRVLLRGKSSGRSDDENVDIIKARILEYQRKTAVVEDYYRRFDKVKRIKGEGTVEEIFAALQKAIDSQITTA